MIYPVGFRRNARHRGPIESMKLSCSSSELKVNLDMLRKTFDNQEVALGLIKSNIESNEMKQCKFRIKRMADVISQINGGV